MKWKNMAMFRKEWVGNLRRNCRLVVCCACTDGEVPLVVDLVDSLRYYLGVDFEVVVQGDCMEDSSVEKLLSVGCWVGNEKKPVGFHNNFYVVSHALASAYDEIEAEYYIKMDPDALMINRGLYDDIVKVFDDVKVGMAGTFRIDWDGGERDMSYWKARMEKSASRLGKVLKRAIANGYRIGDGVQGGAYVINRKCLGYMREQGWLTNYRVPEEKNRWIAEDHLMAMLVYAAGYRVVEMGGPGQSFALWHPGFPEVAPEELEKQGRTVVHALKLNNPEHQRIRAWYRSRRNQNQKQDTE